MKMVDNCVRSLLHGKELSDSDVEAPKAFIASKKVQDLQKIAVELSVRLTSSVRKKWYSREINWYGKDWSNAQTQWWLQWWWLWSKFGHFIYYWLSKERFKGLPGFTSVVEWGKQLKGVLKDLHLWTFWYTWSMDGTNHLISSVVKSLQIFLQRRRKKCLGVLVSLCQQLMLKVLYFCAYVHHSYNCDAPLEVFVSMNPENWDVYSAKCLCVSG